MKKYAAVKNGIISNLAKFRDDADLPDGWIDVSEIDCNKGDPIVGGVPILKPSNYHTRIHDNSGWEITAENQALKDERETPLTDDEIYDKAMQNNALIKAMAISLNGVGAFSLDGTTLSFADLKTLIKSNM